MGRKSRFALILLILTFAAQAGADPIASKLDSRLASKLDPRARIALARRHAGIPLPAMLERRDAVDETGALDVFVRGPVSRAELEAAGARVRTVVPGICTASIPIEAIGRVAALEGVRGITGAAPVEPELEMSIPSTGVGALRGGGPDFTGANGEGVIVGDVDTGVDYDHGDFLTAGGTSRFLNIWDQTVGGAPPAGYTYGSEYTQAQLSTGSPGEVDTHGHGTHVIGIAGGDGSRTGGVTPAYTYAGMAPRADLIAVKTTFLTADIVDGVAYIFSRATTLGKNAVVNLSLGSQYGPHDGTSDFEAALSALTGPGRIIVKSAGNDRANPIHAEVFATNPTNYATVSVFASAGTSNGVVFAIDGYYESTENLNFTVRTPNGTTIGPIALGDYNAPYGDPPGQYTANGYVYVENGVYATTQGDREVYVEVDTRVGQNMTGTWTLTFTPVSIGPANGEVDMWRYYASGGVTYANFVTNNQQEELLSEPGNADSLITAAAWVTRGQWQACNGGTYFYPGEVVGNLATFSSPGPTRSGVLKPDITAPGSAIASTLTQDISPTCTSGNYLGDGLSHQIMEGTSMAAPHVTGAVALLMQHYGAISPSWAKQFLAEYADVSGIPGTWNKDWGWGKLHLPDIVNPTTTVLGPNGGESWDAGQMQNVTWSAGDVGDGVSSVDIKLSRSGPGGPFETVATGVPNTGSRSWVASGPGTANAYVEVIAHDPMGNSGSDLSNAAFTIVDVAGVGDRTPLAFDLGRVSPNPTPGRATVSYTLPREARVRLSIVDVQGRQVAVLADGTVGAGTWTAAWDGRIEGGRAPAGLYFVRFQTPERTLVRRFALAR